MMLLGGRKRTVYLEESFANGVGDDVFVEDEVGGGGRFVLAEDSDRFGHDESVDDCGGRCCGGRFDAGRRVIGEWFLFDNGGRGRFRGGFLVSGGRRDGFLLFDGRGHDRFGIICGFRDFGDRDHDWYDGLGFLVLHDDGLLLFDFGLIRLLLNDDDVFFLLRFLVDNDDLFFLLRLLLLNYNHIFLLFRLLLFDNNDFLVRLLLLSNNVLLDFDNFRFNRRRRRR